MQEFLADDLTAERHGTPRSAAGGRRTAPSKMSGVLIASCRARLESHTITVVAAKGQTSPANHLAREQGRRQVEDNQVHRALHRRLQPLAEEIQFAGGRRLSEQDRDIGITAPSRRSSSNSSEKIGQAHVLSLSKYSADPCCDVHAGQYRCRRFRRRLARGILVGVRGFEPPTPCSQKRSPNQATAFPSVPDSRLFRFLPFPRHLAVTNEIPPKPSEKRPNGPALNQLCDRCAIRERAYVRAPRAGLRPACPP